jgi:transposase
MIASRVASERMVVTTHTRISETNDGMQIKTILNRIHKQRGFVYGTTQLEEQIGGLALTIAIAPHRRNQPQCGGCGQRGGVYDRLAPRRFEFVPLWGLRVFFLYMMRRVDCRRCGVTVEQVPWAEGKHQLTTTYQWFLARWAKRLSWQEVARVFGTSWDQVFRSVARAVAWGRDHLDLAGIRAIGIDEIHWKHGGQFLTLVYQIDPTRKRLLWLGQHRRAKTLLQFFRWFGPERTAALTFICSDMWQPYLQVVAKKASQALHILDRFHIATHLSDAIDQVRREEVRTLRTQGRQPLLTKTRWLLLKRPANQTRDQRIRLRELVRHNLRAVRAMLLRELLEPFWHYRSPEWAGLWLDEWCRRVMRSRLEPMKKVARMLRRYRPLLMNWFRARGEISAAIVEGFNNKAKLTTRKAYGFRSYHCLEIALYHTLGQLPEPEATHRFC